MVLSRARLTVALVLVGLAWVGTTALAPACPFCSENQGPTLVGEFAQAELVLFGTFHNGRQGGGGGLELGTTDFKIENILKTNPIIDGKKIITLRRFIPEKPAKFLIFCDVYKKDIDAYKGVELTAKSDMVKYLVGGLALDKSKASPGERLRYCFDYLQNPEYEISLDAYREFAKADYKDYKDMAKKLDPKVLVTWLKSAETPAYRYGLYASLLGHCGSAKDAEFLRGMIDDPAKKESTGIDGMLFGYIHLDPKKGWAYLTDTLKNSKDFNLRYAALRTCRFLYNDRWDILDKSEKKGKDELVKGVALLLEHKDMADFAIEDLRRWKRWDKTDTVLDFFKRPSHQVGTVKRAVLRFALRCPDKKAQDFVKAQRIRDKEWVSDTEEILQLEDPAPPSSSSTPAPPAPAPNQSSLFLPQSNVLLSLSLMMASGVVMGGVYYRRRRLE